MLSLVFLPTLALLAAALLQLALAPWLSARSKGWLATLGAVAALVGALAQVPAGMDGGALRETLFAWDAGASLEYHVDGLSVLFSVMGTGMGAAILLYSVGYMEGETEGTTRFYFLMLVFIAGLLVLVCSANLLMAYIAWELIGLCSYFLVGFWYRQQAATDGARKVLVITHLAGYGLLAAILVIEMRAGTLVWTDPAVAGAFSTGVAALMIVAAMAKSVMFPLHTWIPEAMNAPTPVSALLHSACYVKAGVYLVARMYTLGPWHDALGDPLLLVGCMTMLVGVFFALAQTDLKRLLAFHTVSQLGYIVTGLALGTSLGIAAALYYTVAHALFKGTLFLCAGAIQHSTGTRDLRQLGGLSAHMPITTAVWLIAAASIAGVPLTTGFVAKWLLFDAALEAGQGAVVMVAWVVSLFTAFSFLKATVSAFYGSRRAEAIQAPIHDAPRSMQVGMGVLAALCLVFGFAPQLVMVPLIEPAARALGFEWQVHMTWLGILTGSGSAGVTVGALAAAVAALLAAMVYRGARMSHGTPVTVFAGGDPLPADGSVGAVDFAELAESALHPVYRLDPDPAYLAAWRGLTRVALGVGNAAHLAFEARPLPAAAALAVLIALMVYLL